MRAIVKFIDGGYVNIPADKIDKKEEWITVLNGKNIIGLFDEGIRTPLTMLLTVLQTVSLIIILH